MVFGEVSLNDVGACELDNAYLQFRLPYSDREFRSFHTIVKAFSFFCLVIFFIETKILEYDKPRLRPYLDYGSVPYLRNDIKLTERMFNAARSHFLYFLRTFMAA